MSYKSERKHIIKLLVVKYEGCSESKISNFVMLAHSVRAGCWYGSRGWTIPLILCYLLLPCDRWQQRGSLKNVIWHESAHEAKMCHWIPPCGKSSTHWCLLNVFGDQTVDVSTGWQWVVHFSSSDSDMKDKPCSGWLCTIITWQNEEHLHQLILTYQLMVVYVLKNSVL